MLRLLLVLSLFTVVVSCISQDRRQGSILRATAWESTWSNTPQIEQTGFYRDFATKKVATKFQPYTPNFELWSDGLHKRRFIYLPNGAAIDGLNNDSWRFPVGTILVKEFSRQLPDSTETRLVETRMIEKTGPTRWKFATYVWNAEQTAAELADENGHAGVFENTGGVPYDVPPYSDCLYCHEGNASEAALGFSAFQLSEAVRAVRDQVARPPGAPPNSRMTQESLSAAGRLRNSEPFLPPPASPAELNLIGYTHANCSHCHNPSGHVEGLDLNFFCKDGEPAHENLPLVRDIMRRAQAPGVSIPNYFQPDYYLIDRGRPETSMLFYRVTDAQGAEHMPRLGTKIKDQNFLSALETWIRGL